MFSLNHETTKLMDSERCLAAFVSRANDAYVMSHTIYDLVNDPDYRRLTIKNGRVMGTPLGSRHILPGYWFTVFVATREALQRVFEAIRDEKESILKKMTSDERNNEGDSEDNGNKIEKINGLLEKFQISLETMMVRSLDNSKSNDTFPNKNPFKRICQSIASGSYEFNEDNDLSCTFYDNDTLCGYRFQATVNVAEFTQFSIDFSKQMVELLRPVIEIHKSIREEVSGMLIGPVFLDG